MIIINFRQTCQLFRKTKEKKSERYELILTLKRQINNITHECIDQQFLDFEVTINETSVTTSKLFQKVSMKIYKSKFHLNSRAIFTKSFVQKTTTTLLTILTLSKYYSLFRARFFSNFFLSSFSAARFLLSAEDLEETLCSQAA